MNLAGERAIAQTKMTILQRARVTGVEVDVTCHGRLYDFLMRGREGWRLCHRQPIYERDRLDPVNPAERPALDRERLLAWPEGYRHLAYVQAEAGYRVVADLPGLTGEPVERLYARGDLWLEGAALTFEPLNIDGAVIGLIVAGRVSDHTGQHKTTTLAWFAIAAALLALLSIRLQSQVLVFCAVLVTGIFVFSAQVLVYAWTTQLYPPELRATALGLTAGIGRLGAILGPFLLGTLVTAGMRLPLGLLRPGLRRSHGGARPLADLGPPRADSPRLNRPPGYSRVRSRNALDADGGDLGERWRPCRPNR
ncbi:hypothetical protein SANTM175S_03633 [Streptomyces antimycoticus]